MNFHESPSSSIKSHRIIASQFPWSIPMKLLVNSHINWFKGQIAGKSRISWDNFWFPVKTFLEVNPLIINSLEIWTQPPSLVLPRRSRTPPPQHSRSSAHWRRWRSTRDACSRRWRANCRRHGAGGKCRVFRSPKWWPKWRKELPNDAKCQLNMKWTESEMLTFHWDFRSVWMGFAKWKGSFRWKRWWWFSNLLESHRNRTPYS